MKTMMTIQVPGGAVEYIYKSQFIEKIARHKVPGGRSIEIPLIGNVSANNYHLSPTERKIVTLDKTIEVSHRDNNPLRLAQILKRAEDGFIDQRLSHIIAKKRPDIIVQDVGMDLVYDLSTKYMEKMGTFPAYLVDIVWNDYQKFLSVVSPEAFSFYMTEPYKYADPSTASYRTALSGELVVLREGHWVMAQYRTNNLLKEMSNNMRYIP